jgi:protein CpxP
MNGTLKRVVAVSALCLGLVAAANAGAQDRPARPNGPPPGAGGVDHRKMFEEMRQRREQRLHDILQIRPDQDAAFHAYLAAVTPPRREGAGPRGAGRERDGQGKPAMTTPERLDRMAARMTERQQRFAQTAAATKAFYGVLNPEQRKAFDAMPMMREGHHGFGHGRRGFEGPPPPPR